VMYQYARRVLFPQTSVPWFPPVSSLLERMARWLGGARVGFAALNDPLHTRQASESPNFGNDYLDQYNIPYDCIRLNRSNVQRMVT
jgi:hypothetical protein